MFLNKTDNCPATILIIEEKPKDIQLLFEYLQNAGYKVLMAQDIKLGIEIAESINPDLILLEAMIARINGFQACRYLKTKSATQNIPIMVIAAVDEISLKLKVFELGAVDFITKPLDRAELLARIKTHLTIQHLNQTLVFEAQQQQLLLEIAERIRQSLDIKTIFQTATNEILKFLRCDRVSLVSLDNLQINIEAESIITNFKEDNLYQITFDDLYYDRQEERNYLQNKCAGDVENLCRLRNSSRRSLTLEAMPSSLQRKARLILPIWLDLTPSNVEKNSHNFLWGWAILDRFNNPQPWQEKEIALMKRLTTQLEIAIQQGLLYKQLQNSNRKLKQLALQDSLTQVFNRRYLDRQLDLEWRRLKRLQAPISIIMCDVDCFKLYNDTYGHQQGDKCLQAVATAITSTFNRSGDVVARYGGEEFIVILPNTSIEGAIKVAETMRRKVKELNIPHVNSLVNSIVTISLGVANTIPDSQTNPNLLVKAVDSALYTAKQRGRDCLAVYRDCLSQSSATQIRELEWNQRLRQALDKDLFSLYAQPIEALGLDDQKRHFEILLRLSDRGDEILTPNDFLEVAERNCLMPNIDTWVIDNLLNTLARF